MGTNNLKTALDLYNKEGKFFSSLSKYMKDGYQDLIEYLNDNNMNYGETSITSHDMVIYNADIYDSGLKRIQDRMKNLKHLDESLENKKEKGKVMVEYTTEVTIYCQIDAELAVSANVTGHIEPDDEVYKILTSNLKPHSIEFTEALRNVRIK